MLRHALKMTRLPVLLTLALALSLAFADTADASRFATQKEMKSLQRIILKHNKTRPDAYKHDRVRGRWMIAIRSDISANWASARISDERGEQMRHLVVLSKKRGRWGVRHVDSYSNFTPTENWFCRKGVSALRIGIDMGIAGFGIGARSGPCRHSATTRKLQRPMTAAELASARQGLEPQMVYDANGISIDFAPPRPPAWRETDYFGPDCEWDATGKYPEGVVSRSNPRWGTITLHCIGNRLVVYTVARSGRSGAFTQSIAEHEWQFERFGAPCTKPKLPRALTPRIRAEIGTCPMHIRGTERRRRMR